MNIRCDVVLDLIPLVKDGIASDGSIELVYEHIKNCESCKAEFESTQKLDFDRPSSKDKKIIYAIKRSIFITQLIILITGAVTGVALSNSMGMFYNFLIMPVIGAVSYITFKKKWYFGCIFVFVLSYIWQSITLISSDGFSLMSISAGLYYSVIYTALVALGALIAILLKFAFKKERQ